MQVMGGPWGSVGSDSAAAAQAACRQLGYATGAVRMGYGTDRKLARVLDFVQCPPGAPSLEACSLSTPKRIEDNTYEWDVLGVACYSARKGEAC